MPSSARSAQTRAAQAALEQLLRTLAPVAVAVSGGVDSMTLAVLAHRTLGEGAEIFHAVSPAVPAQATARVEEFAARDGWRLRVVDAGEFRDPNYLDNPVNRCFYCKSNLYDTLVARTDAQIVSGTNLDDLGDFRPGLRAAADRSVRHPFVEAGIDKAAVRALARRLGLSELAELPSAPCLSSRVQTGIPIAPQVLGLVNDVERYLQDVLRPRTVRCRERADGVVIELDEHSLAALPAQRRQRLATTVAGMFRDRGLERQVAFSPYRMGSAFLRSAASD